MTERLKICRICKRPINENSKYETVRKSFTLGTKITVYTCENCRKERDKK